MIFENSDILGTVWIFRLADQIVFATQLTGGGCRGFTIETTRGSDGCVHSAHPQIEWEEQERVLLGITRGLNQSADQLK